MTTLHEAAQQALGALEAASSYDIPSTSRVRTAIATLRAALAEPDIDPVDEYRKGFIDGQIDMRDRPEEQPEPVQEPVGNSYADLFNALQRIETAAVFLPSFKITHEGGLEAVVQNIVDAIARAVEAAHGIKEPE